MGARVEALGQGLWKAQLPAALARAVGAASGASAGPAGQRGAPGRAEGRPDGRPVLLATDPGWASRVPDAALLSPGSEGAARLAECIQEHARFAVLAHLGAAGAQGLRGGLRRCLWFRFRAVASGGSPPSQRAFNVDVVVDPATEAPVPPSVLRPLAVLRVPVSLAWVSAYEIERLAGLAAHEAARLADARLEDFRRQLGEELERERSRLCAYFAACRQEALAGAVEAARRAQAALAYSLVAGAAGDGRGLAARAAAWAGAVRGRGLEAAKALEAIDAEERHARAELEGRFQVTARFEAAGLAVLWAAIPVPETW